MSNSPKFLVMGCGAIGGVVTASLTESGHDVTAVTTNESIHAAVKERGLELVGDGAPRRIPVKISLGVPAGETFDHVLLATQPPQVEEAARAALPAASPDGRFVCLQNGLCEERVAKIAGRERVIGAVVGWGATMPGTGVYERTAPGGFTLGALGGGSLEAPALARALETVGPVETTTNLRGKRWSKLAINCAISTLGTIGGERLGPLIAERFVRRLALEIMTETVEVARHEDVRLEKVSGTLDLQWIALTEEDRRSTGSASLLAKHSLLMAVGFRYRRMKSSMLSAIERGRVPAVDFLNGEVVERAKAHGLHVPVNARARELVWAIARRERPAGLALLRELSEAAGPRRG